MNGVWDIFDFAWQNPEQNEEDLPDEDEDDPSVPLAIEDGNPNATDEESEVTTTQPEQTAENDAYENNVEQIHLEDSQPQWEPVLETPHLEDVIPPSQLEFESGSDIDDGNHIGYPTLEECPPMIPTQTALEPEHEDPTKPDQASPPQAEPPSQISDSNLMLPPSSILTHRQRLQARMDEIRPGVE